MLITIDAAGSACAALIRSLGGRPNTLAATDLGWGTLYAVFCAPDPDRCDISLILDVDPIGILEEQRFGGPDESSLDHYVNDRAYATSAFFAAALREAFWTESGDADARAAISVTLHSVPCRGGESEVSSLFEPLGWRVDCRSIDEDAQFPGWGSALHLDVELRGETSVRELIEQLIMILPALDDSRHHWLPADVESVAAPRWLETHPARTKIEAAFARRDRELVGVGGRFDEVDSAESHDPDARSSTPESETDGGVVVQTELLGPLALSAASMSQATDALDSWAEDATRVVYLPPTMTPPVASRLAHYLEHPAESFDSYRRAGINRLICEKKHMGTRAVLSVRRRSTLPTTKNASATGGSIVTRTGRPFFDETVTEKLLDRIEAAAETAGLWDELGTDWMVFDAELLPWSLKAGALILGHFAAIGTAGRNALGAALGRLDNAARYLDVRVLREKMALKERNLHAFMTACVRFGGPGDGSGAVTLAPFQLLAADQRTFAQRDHGWHLSLSDRLVEADPELFITTPRIVVDCDDSASIDRAIHWWETLTEAGAEGMVVKPFDNAGSIREHTVQPGLKVRGREYLRIVYGPDYTESEQLGRLRDRDVGTKEWMALREYALGQEALRRAVEGEGGVLQAVLAILAVETEAVDPRL